VSVCFLDEWQDAEDKLLEVGGFLLYVARQLRIHDGEVESSKAPESLHRLAKLCDSRRAEYTDVLGDSYKAGEAA
jgi:hypothetical protein